MDSSAFNHIFEGLDAAFKLFVGLILLIPVLIGIIIYLALT